MKLYKGRLPDDVSPLMDEINRSLPFDLRLLPYDVATNRAWVDELAHLEILTRDEQEAVLDALDELLADYGAGAFDPLPADEDVHTLVERYVTERVGPAGARIHTGRSRNDQVVCDLRLYAMDALESIERGLIQAITAVVDRGEEHAETPMAGTTHLQPALPITLGHFLLSLAHGLKRDTQRCRQAYQRTARCPLGAGAMAGSGFPVDRERLARTLGFQGVLENSIDAVSDRDFCQEIAAVCAGVCVRLSRYAEQFVTWANPAFGYVRFSSTWSTGSSMMPQKRNPDAMELVRGKAARMIGHQTTLMTLTKGLPLTYAKDLQEDKQPLFDILDTTELVLNVFARALASAKFLPDRLAAALSADMLATDIADALALAGVPFRAAHERVGHAVSEWEQQGRNLDRIDPDELLARFPELRDDPPKLTAKGSIERRDIRGGTAVRRVREQIDELRDWLRS